MVVGAWSYSSVRVFHQIPIGLYGTIRYVLVFASVVNGLVKRWVVARVVAARNRGVLASGDVVVGDVGQVLCVAVVACVVDVLQRMITLVVLIREVDCFRVLVFVRCVVSFRPAARISVAIFADL